MKALSLRIVVSFCLLIPFTLLSQDISYDYEKMFTYIRELMVRPPVKKLLKATFENELVLADEFVTKYGYPKKLSSFSETQFLLLLQSNPETFKLLDDYIKDVPTIDEGNLKQVKLREEYTKKFKKLLSSPEILETFQSLNDPTQALLLKTPNGKPGYKNVKLVVGHEHFKNMDLALTTKGTYNKSNISRSQNLLKFTLSQIEKAKKTIDINVFEFDIVQIAELLCKKASQGILVRVGIDGHHYKGKANREKVVKTLSGCKDLKLTLVDSVKLNHQKIMVVDGYKITAGTANWTYSGMHPNGDYPNIKDRRSITRNNANHLLYFESEIAGTVISHELTKTLDLKFKGTKEYFLNGAYKLEGAVAADGIIPKMIFSFTPNGALGDVSEHFIARAVLDAQVPTEMKEMELLIMQFAFSHSSITEAIVRKYVELKELGKSMNLLGVSDTDNAFASWSQFLALACLKPKKVNGEKIFIEDPDCVWKDHISDDELKKIRDGLKIAPDFYTKGFISMKGLEKKVRNSAIIHAKIFIIAESLAILGTSVNASAGASKNQEQIFLFANDKIVKTARGMVHGLHALSDKTIFTRAQEKNCNKMLEIKKSKSKKKN